MPSTPNAPPTLPHRPLLSSSSPLTARAFPSSSHPATNAPSANQGAKGQSEEDAEGTPDAEIYARLMTHRILEGNVGQVVKGLRQTVTKRNLSGSKAKILLSVAAYFHRNRDRMRYHDYLAQGLPIASGFGEGACKNLIKDRMERSGMRWTQSMAEAVVKLRALYLSGDFNTYWDFHIREDQQRLYPPGRWAVVVK